MAFNHVTIGTVASTAITNVNFELQSATLTAVGVALQRTNYPYNSLTFHAGLTPPGDQQIQIYMNLLSGNLSPGDGMTWSGSLRLRDTIYLVINYISAAPVFIFLTWTTTS